MEFDGYKNLGVSLDPGTKNGLVIFNYQTMQYEKMGIFPIWQVFSMLSDIKDDIKLLLIEDARLNFNAKGSNQERAQGAGWVKVLSGQYEKFAIDELNLYDEDSSAHGSYRLIRANKEWTKKDEEYVFNHTGFRIPGSETSDGQNLRDALMMFRFRGQKHDITIW